MLRRSFLKVLGIATASTALSKIATIDALDNKLIATKEEQPIKLKGKNGFDPDAMDKFAKAFARNLEDSRIKSKNTV